jgi:hypothetical protein
MDAQTLIAQQIDACELELTEGRELIEQGNLLIEKGRYYIAANEGALSVLRHQQQTLFPAGGPDGELPATTD